MGTGPAINIEVYTTFDSASKLAKELCDWIPHTVVESENTEEYIEYICEWNDTIDTGEDEHLQRLHIMWSTERNEYVGTGEGEKLLIHYSPYYYEESLRRFADKATEMEKILDWLEEHTDMSTEIDHYVASCTT